MLRFKSAWLIEGAPPEAVLKAEPGVASCDSGSQPLATREARDPARQALRPGCEELAVRCRRKCRKRKRGPRPKIATVERREARLPAPQARLRASVTRYGEAGISA